MLDIDYEKNLRDEIESHHWDDVTQILTSMLTFIQQGDTVAVASSTQARMKRHLKSLSDLDEFLAELNKASRMYGKIFVIENGSIVDKPNPRTPVEHLAANDWDGLEASLQSLREELSNNGSVHILDAPLWMSARWCDESLLHPYIDYLNCEALKLASPWRLVDDQGNIQRTPA